MTILCFQPKILPVMTVGDPVLRLVAKPIKPAKLRERKMQEFIDDMLTTLEYKNGLGLSAPQVNRSIRLFVMDGEERVRVVANPKVLEACTLWEKDSEGCFSVLDGDGGTYIGLVERPLAIAVQYHDRDGKRVSEILLDLEARTFLHELDHLHGVLLVDHWEESGAEVITEAEYVKQFDDDSIQEMPTGLEQRIEKMAMEAGKEADDFTLEWEPFTILSPPEKRMAAMQKNVAGGPTPA